MNKEQDCRELNDIFSALREFLSLYGALKSGQTYCTPEITKNVQDSIKELCTIIIQKTSN